MQEDGPSRRDDSWLAPHPGLAGEWVVVTGANGLIGGDVVRRLRALGARILAVDKSAAEEADERPDEFRFLRVDLGLESGRDEVLDLAEEVGARSIVHAAGWQVPDGRNRMPTAREWEDVLLINVTAPALLTSAVMEAAHLRGSSASAVFLSSVHEHLVFSDPSYGAAKGAVHNVVRELAALGASHGSRVNAVAPGDVNAEPSRSEPTRLGRLTIPPRSVSIAVAFLVCDDCSPHTTGATLFVDGGMRLNDPWTPDPRPARRWRRK